jgi:glyoxylase-like metal-dependent hydrolase (beta-lactamase superfamily II)
LHDSSRRRFLQHAAAVGGGALALRYAPSRLWDAAAHASQVPQAAVPQSDPAAAMRAQIGSAPIQQTRLSDRLVMLSGPGGNVVVLHGPDGKIVVDTFVQPAWPHLKAFLDRLDRGPLTMLIDTHWHFDHTDNNAGFHAAGAAIVAHANTKKRLMESHDLLGMHFNPAPAAALPTETFVDRKSLTANGEIINLWHAAPAHTDTDIFVHYTKANVLHLGDVFFNGTYPFIDVSTGGGINGRIAGADRALALANARTKVVPGHGPLSDHVGLLRYRKVIGTIRDKVRRQKRAGRGLTQVQASKPGAEFDAEWGRGMLPPDDFIALVYNTV